MEIKKLRSDVVIPDFATTGSCAIDLVCPDNITIYPGDTVNIKTGLSIWINDPNIAALIIPRSGLGSKGLVLGNGTGLIDSDYQGELIVPAWNRLYAEIYGVNVCKREKFNHGDNIDLWKGDRFAQLMFIPIIKPVFTLVDEFSEVTKRGENGFGSSG